MTLKQHLALIVKVKGCPANRKVYSKYTLENHKTFFLLNRISDNNLQILIVLRKNIGFMLPFS